jgi:uncharacterized protein
LAELSASQRALGHDVLMDQMGRLELHYCALEGDVPGINERISRGDPADAADNAGYTPLHFAAQESQTDAVRALLEAGASVDAQDAHGNTPLWRAVFGSKGQVEVVNILLSAGANPDHTNTSGVTPRQLAEQIASTDVRTAFE